MAGVAGNISAYDLRKAAKRLESAAGERDESRLSELLKSVEDAFRMTTESIAALGQTDEKQKAEQKNTAPADLNRLPDMLEDLKRCLDNLDPFGSSEVIEKIQEQTLPEDVEEKIKTINLLVKDFGFDEADDILSEIIKMIAL